MLTKEAAKRLQAFISAKWMGVARYEEGPSECNTCGYGGETFAVVELEQVLKMVDEFVESGDNK